MNKTLCVIPVYCTRPEDYDILETTVRTLRGTARDHIEVMMVDDGSPEESKADRLTQLAEQWQCELILKEENEGFSRTVNVGLQRALDEERHAILVNADLEFRHPGWVQAMEQQGNIHHDTGMAWVVGALLSFPNGLVQHAGIYFSLLTRSFDHISKFSPENLPGVKAYRCVPVTGALQFIRHECMASIGIYDPEFRMAFEDVDYCLRVFQAQQECVFHPGIQAYHHESIFRGRGDPKVQQWTRESLALLMKKWHKTSMASLVPTW